MKSKSSSIQLTIVAMYIIQIYHVWEGYLRKIPVERRNISRAEWLKPYTNVDINVVIIPNPISSVSKGI